jgi:uncharacterized membrane protein
VTDENLTPDSAQEITSDDKLWGALSYFALIAIIMLLTEDKKNRPFIKYHAVQAIAFSVVLAVASIILGIIPVVQCFTPLLWLILIWPAVGAYGGNYTVIPVISDFIKKQGWV